MGRAAGDRLHTRQVAELRLHLYGRCAVFDSNVVAELALVVDAPAPYRAVGAQRQASLAARGDSHDVAEHAVASEALHLYGRRTVLKRGVPQLTAVIGPPRPNRAVALERETMRLAGSNRLDPGEQSIAPRTLDRQYV